MWSLYSSGENDAVESAKFTNCYFEMEQLNITNATFNNCILRYNSDSQFTITGCTFNKCLMNNEDVWVMGEGSSKTDCYDLDRDNFSSDKNYLTTNNYFGSDGTIVGEYGGTNPFNGGRSYAAGVSIQNLNKKGNKMSPSLYIYDR